MAADAPLDAAIDHVAIAVPSWEIGERRWKEQLGGGVVSFGTTPAFQSRQLRFANGGKLELLAPPPDAGPENFVRRFLERFGSRIHHVTLKVPHLPTAIERLRAADLEPVDISMDNAFWHEAFLRPSLVGGLVVQVAWAANSDEQWAKAVGHEPEPPRADARTLSGPLLTHPDLDQAERLWRLLGAEIGRDEGGLLASWPGAALSVRIVRGEDAAAVALLSDQGETVPADAESGPELRVWP